MNVSIKLDKLEDLINDHAQNLDLSFETKTFFVQLDELANFLAAAKRFNETFNTVQLSIIRHPMKTSDDRIKLAGKGLSQPSLIFIPVRVRSFENWIPDPLDATVDIPVLKVCVPGETIGRDTTGVCPPRGNCK